MCGLVDKGALGAVDKQEREAGVSRSHHKFSLASPHDSLAAPHAYRTDRLDTATIRTVSTAVSYCMVFPVLQLLFPLRARGLRLLATGVFHYKKNASTVKRSRSIRERIVRSYPAGGSRLTYPGILDAGTDPSLAHS